MSAQPDPIINPKLLRWALGREHTCSICGAEQGVLIIGTLDRRGRRFAFRCPSHVKVSPILRAIHVITHPVSPHESALLERVTRAVRMPPNAKVLAGTDEEGSRGDSAWFQAHSHRSHRVRALTRGEREAFRAVSPSDAAFTHAIVRQVEPGSRLKCPIDFTHCPHFVDALSDSPETDFFLSELFDAVFSGEKPFSIRSVMEAARAKYAASGHA
jgi:hypothetical protein